MISLKGVMTMRVNKNIVIENARIGFRNFSGEEGQFNPAGRRNFCVFLDFDMGKVLEEDGWNVRWLAPREEEDQETPYLQVAVSYANIPPKILLISTGSKTMMNDDTVGMLDWAEIENVDIIIRPYNWEIVNKKETKSGVKAYVKSMYITIVEDEFSDKYADIPLSGSRQDPDLDEEDEETELPY